ncbi:MAG TPA: phosphodiester glycosidase family protein, partial [Longimicrobiaceae bacterium]|nr:phosphodiester glycosidase family protein [Longimicrobiaceae bacterium]
RSAVGWRADGTLLLVAVDGRRPGYSEGMSLAELRSLFLELGAAEALNLDGGGSTALVVRGATVNRPSDREGERAVANALVLLGPPAGAAAAARRRCVPERERRGARTARSGRRGRPGERRKSCADRDSAGVQVFADNGR